MRTVSIQELQEGPDLFREVSGVLDKGGLVCLPCLNTYRIVADLTGAEVVTRLLQSKRRTSTAPSLVFVDGEEMLARVASEITPAARDLARRHWPGPLTILFPTHPDLPRKVVKQVAKATGKIGVRVPADPMTLKLLRIFGRPLLVSSANRQHKQGAGSAAQVRKNFARHVDLFIDAGDLQAGQPSTVVDLTKDGPVVTRPGAIAAEDLL